jgi:hypothetical protein
MRRLAQLAASTLLALVMVVAARAQHPPPETVRTFTVKYADGRTTNQVLSDKGRVSWTAKFPRVAGVDTSREGLPLSALQFEQARDGRNLQVTVALLYGSPHQLRRKVTTVALDDNATVTVGELTDHGVQPVVLSISTLPAPQLAVPAITSPSSLLTVSVEVAPGGTFGYRLVFDNRSPVAVMGFAFRAYRGDAPVASGQPRQTGHLPLIPANTRYVYNLNPFGSIDRIAIEAVIWSDGIVEGDTARVAGRVIVDAGLAYQLERIVGLLRTAARTPADHPLPDLRASIAALPVKAPSREGPLFEIGMQQAKNGILNDLDAYARAVDQPYAQFLPATVVKFDGWLKRIREQ